MRASTDSPLRVLYLVYWGAAEPLGQSLVLPAVKKLAESGVNLTLITFEKPDDFLNESLIRQIRLSLAERNVQWIPLRYHKNPKIVFDLIQGVCQAIWIGMRERPDIVHARTFIGGLMGLLIAPLLQAKFIFHNEGFFPDEQVDGGVWKEASWIHRTFKFLERQMYARADGIIALSHRAQAIIQRLPQVIRKNIPVIVVPSCVDLDNFQWNPVRPSVQSDGLHLVYIGSVGRRYLLDKIGNFVAFAKQELGTAHLCVLTHTEPGVVNSLLGESTLLPQDWALDKVSRPDIPARLATQHVGIHFLPKGLSEHSGSPTKIGEYWAAGLPVIVTPNTSDTDEIINREKVGVVVKAHTDEAYRQACQELSRLLADPELSVRCRRVAAKYFALEAACVRQHNFYSQVVNSSAKQASVSEKEPLAAGTLERGSES